MPLVFSLSIYLYGSKTDRLELWCLVGLRIYFLQKEVNVSFVRINWERFKFFNMTSQFETSFSFFTNRCWINIPMVPFYTFWTTWQPMTVELYIWNDQNQSKDVGIIRYVFSFIITTQTMLTSIPIENFLLRCFSIINYVCLFIWSVVYCSGNSIWCIFCIFIYEDKN